MEQKPPTYLKSIENAFRTERLLYRAIEEDDEDKAFLWEMENDPVIGEMSSLGYCAPKTKAESAKFFEFTKDNLLRAFMCLPPTEEKAKPTPVGLIALWPKAGDSPHNRSAMLGINVAAGHRGKGYGGEAINWVLDFGFNRAGLHRIELGALSYNPSAIALYKKLGFVEEGRNREAILYERKWHDLVLMSVLEDEWEQRKNEEAKGKSD
ncbi:acyl-CoA N-acyltransferase [Podospora didyma]|uniref:Acyl-CoA N-acyltransferase n=1 Tax=Podospora didyma TaxID=330526 RepID=A0AAE0KLT3_9PEZI|nr:acyl-CoA N-acyltransferase [Podospora didyma]